VIYYSINVFEQISESQSTQKFLHIYVDNAQRTTNFAKKHEKFSQKHPKKDQNHQESLKNGLYALLTTPPTYQVTSTYLVQFPTIKSQKSHHMHQ
ncbi:hypothetical protein, partial [Anaerobiospirillum succiniciproducens]|uniref:hypothetical protein n=1 Tax=Anaerobiospirillum succiniciproducens TaxID=13335 RepID=UPI00248D8929